MGIDPSNIRVTNIVRENSVGRKKRDTTEPATIEFAIGPPPLDELVEFIPEEYTYYPPTENRVLEPPIINDNSTRR